MRITKQFKESLSSLLSLMAILLSPSISCLITILSFSLNSSKLVRELGFLLHKENTVFRLTAPWSFYFQTHNLPTSISMPLEKAMAPHSSTVAWKIPWTEEPGGLQSMGLLESDTTEQLYFHFSLSCTGEGNGNPLQCSCLENFEHYFANVWDECNCVVVGALFGIAYLWEWNENWPFPVLWPLLSFPNLLAVDGNVGKTCMAWICCCCC